MKQSLLCTYILLLLFSYESFGQATYPVVFKQPDSLKITQDTSNGNLTLLEDQDWVASCNVISATTGIIEITLNDSLTGGDQFWVGTIPDYFIDYNNSDPIGSLFHGLEITFNGYTVRNSIEDTLIAQVTNISHAPGDKYSIHLSEDSISFYKENTLIISEEKHSAYPNNLKVGLILAGRDTATQSIGINLKTTSQAPSNCNEPFDLDVEVTHATNNQSNGSIKVVSSNGDIFDSWCFGDGTTALCLADNYSTSKEWGGLSADTYYINVSSFGGGSVSKTVTILNIIDGVDLELGVSASDTVPDLYDNVSLTFKAKNTGTENATGVIVNVPVIDDFAYVSQSLSQGTYSYYQDGPWNIGNLNIGDSATLQLTLFANTTEPRIVFAQVNALDSTDVDSSPDNNSGSIPAEDDEAAIGLNAKVGCNISTPTIQTTCSDNGTELDPNDDTFTFTLNTDGLNLGANYHVSGDVSDSTISYGSAQQIGGSHLINNGILTITLTDSLDNTCQLEDIIIYPPSSCSGTRNLEWNNIDSTNINETNGTYTGTDYNNSLISCNEIDGSNGWLEFTLNSLPTGNFHYRIGFTTDNTGFIGWNGFEYSLGFENGQGGAHYFTSSGYGGYISNSFTSGGIFKMGIVGDKIQIWYDGQFIGEMNKTHTASALRIALAIQTNTSPGFDIDLEASSSCGGDYCEILSANIETTCDDNGTPDNSNDDLFSFTLIPTGIDLTATYDVTGAVMANGISYDSTKQIGGTYPIIDGSFLINIIDENDTNCSLDSVLITPPDPCSDGVNAPSGEIEWENIDSVSITNTGDNYSGEYASLLSCNVLDRDDGYIRFAITSLPTDYEFRIGLAEENPTLSGNWTDLKTAIGFDAGYSGLSIYNPGWSNQFSNTLALDSIFEIRIDDVNDKFEYTYQGQTITLPIDASLTGNFQVVFTIANNTGDIGITFDPSSSCGGNNNSTCPNNLGDGTSLYPGDLMFTAFDNNAGSEKDIIAIRTDIDLETGTRFSIVNAEYEQNRWFSADGIRNGEIASQEITYTGIQTIGAGSIISFELPATGNADSLLAKNFRIDEVASSDFCVANNGNTNDPKVNISTTGADALFLVQGSWSFNSLYGSLSGRVLSGLQDGGLWGDIPDDIDCIAIQAFDTPGSHCPYFDTIHTVSVQNISDFGNWNQGSCTPGDDLSNTNYRIAEEDPGSNPEVLNGYFPTLKAYPNPFYENATIEFSLPRDLDTQIQIFDARGRLVKVLIPKTTTQEGIHYKRLNTVGWSAGIYTIVMQAGGHRLIQRVSLIRL